MRRVSCLEEVWPVVMLPKAKLVGESVSWEVGVVGATPVPLNAMGAAAAVELLEMVTLPVTLPELTGAKRTVPAKFAPAAMVSGKVKPEIEKPVPETAIAETVRVAVPVFRNMRA